jgi:hypothetical protein
MCRTRHDSCRIGWHHSPSWYLLLRWLSTSACCPIDYWPSCYPNPYHQIDDRVDRVKRVSNVKSTLLAGFGLPRQHLGSVVEATTAHQSRLDRRSDSRDCLTSALGKSGCFQSRLCYAIRADGVSRSCDVMSSQRYGLVISRR